MYMIVSSYVIWVEKKNSVGRERQESYSHASTSVILANIMEHGELTQVRNTSAVEREKISSDGLGGARLLSFWGFRSLRRGSHFSP